MGRGQLEEFLDQLAKLGGVVSGLEAIVAEPERILARHASGYLVGGERLAAGSGARFDAASLTKPWIATLALVLDRGKQRESQDRFRGQDHDRDPARSRGFHRRERLPALALETLSADERKPSLGSFEGGDEAPTAEDLLRHRSGMPAWTPLALRLGKRLEEPPTLRDFLLSERAPGRSPERPGRPPAEVSSSVFPINESLSLLPEISRLVVYSDLDYLLWGLLAEERTGTPLASLLDEAVCAPLGIAALGAIASSGEIPGAVECRLDNGKEIELAARQGLKLQQQRSFLRGVPQDGNARALLAAGRLPAHAGLFVTADEMLALGREWLRPGQLVSPAEVASALSGEGDYALGWARWSEEGSSGPALSAASFGHTGFTGGSLWIDPERSRLYLLLAHRLSSAIDFNPFRREFHRLAAEV